MDLGRLKVTVRRQSSDIQDGHNQDRLIKSPSREVSKYSVPSAIRSHFYRNESTNVYMSKNAVGKVPSIMINSVEISDKRTKLLGFINNTVMKPLNDYNRYLMENGFDVQCSAVFGSWCTLMTAVNLYYSTLVSYGVDLSSNPPVSRRRYMSVITKVKFTPPTIVPDLDVPRVRVIGSNVERAFTISMITNEPTISTNVVNVGRHRYNIDRWHYKDGIPIFRDVDETIYGSNGPSSTCISSMHNGNMEIRGRHSIATVEYYDFLSCVASQISDKTGRDVRMSDLGNSDIDACYGMSINKLRRHIDYSVPGTDRGPCISVSKLKAIVRHAINDSPLKHKFLFMDRYEYDSYGSVIFDSLESISMYPHNSNIYRISTTDVLNCYETESDVVGFLEECIITQLSDCCTSYIGRLTDSEDPLYNQFNAKVRKLLTALYNNTLYMIEIKIDDDFLVNYSVTSGSNVWFTCGNPGSDPIIMIPTVETLSILYNYDTRKTRKYASHIDFTPTTECKKGWAIRFFVGGGIKYTGNPVHCACAFTLFYDTLKDAMMSNLSSFISSLQICHMKDMGSKDQVTERFYNIHRKVDKIWSQRDESDSEPS